MPSKQRTIVLIHGYGFDPRIWLPVEIAFNGDEVISFSLPGFGEDSVTGPYSIAELARHYWAVLQEKNETSVHLVGHSMGGYICMEMIAQQPHRVSSLCLLHSHVFADTQEKKKNRSTVLEEIKSSGSAPFIRRMITSMVYEKNRFGPILDILIHRGMQFNDDAWYNGTMAIRDRNDHAETLTTFKSPCLMIMGAADAAVPISLAYKQASLAEQTSLIVYPNVGHLSMYENTAALISDLAVFYSGL